jgi:hypothetical protein
MRTIGDFEYPDIWDCTARNNEGKTVDDIARDNMDEEIFSITHTAETLNAQYDDIIERFNNDSLSELRNSFFNVEERPYEVDYMIVKICDVIIDNLSELDDQVAIVVSDDHVAKIVGSHYSLFNKLANSKNLPLEIEIDDDVTDDVATLLTIKISSAEHFDVRGKQKEPSSDAYGDLVLEELKEKLQIADAFGAGASGVGKIVSEHNKARSAIEIERDFLSVYDAFNDSHDEDLLPDLISLCCQHYGLASTQDALDILGLSEDV